MSSKDLHGGASPRVRRGPPGTAIGSGTMRRYLTMLAAVGLVLAASGARADDILNIGDPAPKLDVSGWVKGEKVESVRAGQDVRGRVLGDLVRALPDEHPPPHRAGPQVQGEGRPLRRRGRLGDTTRSKVKPFVAEMGDKMDYSVAMDNIPVGRQADGRRDGEDLDGRRGGARHPGRVHHPRRQDRLDRPPDADGSAAREGRGRHLGPEVPDRRRGWPGRSRNGSSRTPGRRSRSPTGRTTTGPRSRPSRR